MSAYRLYFALMLLLLAALTNRLSDAVAQESTLTATDKRYLESLFKEFLFDPKGARRVIVKTTVRSVWAGAGVAEVEGWYLPGIKGTLGRVYFIDGASIPAPPEKDMQTVDFVATCQARYQEPPPKQDNPFPKMRLNAVGQAIDADLYLAAWLHRLGQEKLAARAFAAARAGKGDPRLRLREDLAWSAFAGMIHAYMVRADEEALAHGERFLRLYAAEVKTKDYGQAVQVVAELQRRRKEGTFGKAPTKQFHDGFDKWEPEKKVEYLILTLEEVDARQDGQPGGVDFAADRRVDALIRLGDIAVPALIEVLEKDERLTRSVHFWRAFARTRRVLSVREASLNALMSILRLHFFKPRSTGDNFTSRGGAAAKDLADRLRAYWKDFGSLPFDERMMKMLSDPQTKFEAKRETAVNLATLHLERRLGTMVWTDSTKPLANAKPNPAVAKFNQPTAAEAILAAADADLKTHGHVSDYAWGQSLETYLWALVQLGDKRIAAALTRQAGIADTFHARQQWAKAAEKLGEPNPLAKIAENFRAAKILLSPGEPGQQELRNLVTTLMEVGTPEADRALYALTDRKHPFHQMVAKRLLAEPTAGRFDRPWFAHPYALRMLRQALEDPSPTGSKYLIEKDTLWRIEKGGSGSSEPLPSFLADPATRREAVAERVCDVAALKLHALVVGVPLYHPLFQDADKRLAACQVAVDRFAGNYRKAMGGELKILNVTPWTAPYLPDIRPLGRAATAADVKEGKAIFHLDGKGEVAELKLPAVAVWKRDEKQANPVRLLILQAEMDADGVVVYGVLTAREVRRVRANEVTHVQTLAQWEQAEREASAKPKGRKQ